MEWRIVYGQKYDNRGEIEQKSFMRVVLRLTEMWNENVRANWMKILGMDEGSSWS